MGDRAIIRVRNNGEIDDGICTYLHWNGSDALEYLKGAIKRMRKGELSYSTARLIGYCPLMGDL